MSHMKYDQWKWVARLLQSYYLLLAPTLIQLIIWSTL